MSSPVTSKMFGAFLCGVAALAIIVFAPRASADSGDRIDVRNYSPEMRERYQVFAVKCSKCHSLARPINSHMKGDEWKNYVKKMIRRPASGINEESGRQIYEFLKYYSSVKASAASSETDGGL